MPLDTEHLRTTLRALDASVVLYRQAQAAGEATHQEIFRLAIVKGFELVQEVCFKLLRRRLRDFGLVSRGLEATPVKELLRLGAQHGLLTMEEVERWFAYRDNRNDTAHDYGDGFVSETLRLMPAFVQDVRALEPRLQGGEAEAP